jgi:hypothetical protein
MILYQIVSVVVCAARVADPSQPHGKKLPILWENTDKRKTREQASLFEKKILFLPMFQKIYERKQAGLVAT